MKNTAEALRATVRRRLRRERALLAVILAAWAALLALSMSDALPALHADLRVSGFLSGFIMGIFVVAGGITARRAHSLRRALADDAELRRRATKLLIGMGQPGGSLKRAGRLVMISRMVCCALIGAAITALIMKLMFF